MQKLLPPFLFILFAITVCVYQYLANPATLVSYPINLLGVILLFFGVLLAAKGKRQFAQVETNIQTFGQPNTLVTCGLFQYTRNPMYLGFCIALFGVCVLNGLAFEYIALEALFIVIVNKWYIAFEEKMMQQTFGQEYKEYCNNVRRWI